MLQKVLSTLTDKPPKDTLDPRCRRYLRELGVHEPLLVTFDECAYSGAIRIGRLWLSPLGEVDLENRHEENRPCVEHGFLIVGSGLNGDPIALELSAGKMAFVSHDLLWERDYEAFEQCVVRSPFGFDDFWRAALENEDFPVDSHDAAEVWRSE